MGAGAGIAWSECEKVLPIAKNYAASAGSREEEAERTMQGRRRSSIRLRNRRKLGGCIGLLILLVVSLPFLFYRTSIERALLAPKKHFPTSVCLSVQQNPVQHAVLKCYHPILFGLANSRATMRSTDADGCFTVADYLYDTANCHIIANGGCYRSTALAHVAVGKELSLGRELTPPRPAPGGNRASDARRQMHIALPYQKEYCGDFQASANGCGPDFLPSGVRFILGTALDLEEPCSVHDNCYDGCDTPRSVCDQQLHDDVLQACPSCRWIAYVMFMFVNGPLGRIACTATRKSGCSSDSLCVA